MMCKTKKRQYVCFTQKCEIITHSDIFKQLTDTVIEFR